MGNERRLRRFGRRAETLPEDRMLLALEEVEQTEAGATAETAAKSTIEPAAALKSAAQSGVRCRQHLPWI
jgi:hypothetical protein